MLTPSEAEQIISQSIPTLPAEDCPLAQAFGRVLRGPVVADRDLPPFDRVTMDGYALRAGAARTGPVTFRVTGFQAAGMMPLAIEADDACVEIATGAVLPKGADCVVPYEDVRRDGNSIAVSGHVPLESGCHVHRRASDHPAGSTLVAPGVRLTGREIAVAASCGSATLRVAMTPRIAVVATGDELAEVETPTIAAHQIRRSNDHALRASLLGAGYGRVERFHLRDVREEILSAMQRIMSEFDVLILTGGVSKGKFDYLPGVLSQLAVARKFQGVAQKPGKPFWFGITSRNTPVFALPGNPVSTYTCFCRYVLPALSQMSGATAERPDYAVLEEPIAFRAKLAYLLPVSVQTTSTGERRARPMATNTSGDLAGLLGTTGFLELPAGPESFPAGTVGRYWPWQ